MVEEYFDHLATSTNTRVRDLILPARPAAARSRESQILPSRSLKATRRQLQYLLLLVQWSKWHPWSLAIRCAGHGRQTGVGRGTLYPPLVAGGLAAQMVVFFLMWGRDWIERKLWGNQGASRSSLSGKQEYNPTTDRRARMGLS